MKIIIQGKFLLPIFFVLLILHIIFSTVFFKKLETKKLIARGVSKTSIDLKRSFKSPERTLAKIKTRISGKKGSNSENIEKNIEISSFFNEKDGRIAAEYLGKVLAQIESRKNYPEIAELNELEGTVKIYFAINRNGTLKTIKILSSSKHDILDRSAYQTIQAAVPFEKADFIDKLDHLPVIIDMQYEYYK
jgi:periplasmic protein TonB